MAEVVVVVTAEDNPFPSSNETKILNV